MHSHTIIRAIALNKKNTRDYIRNQFSILLDFFFPSGFIFALRLKVLKLVKYGLATTFLIGKFYYHFRDNQNILIKEGKTTPLKK